MSLKMRHAATYFSSRLARLDSRVSILGLLIVAPIRDEIPAIKHTSFAALRGFAGYMFAPNVASKTSVGVLSGGSVATNSS